jgi:hypothetical protein
MNMSAANLNRRTFLRGAGGALLSLPLLEAMGASKTTQVPVRMVCVGNNFGYIPKLFFPTETGPGYTMPTLLNVLEPHREDFSIFSQLDHGTEGVGGHGGVHAFLSGILAKNSKGYDEGNISMDQKAAAHVGGATRYPSMQLACGSSTGSRLSWTSSGAAIPPVEDLTTLFSLLFQATNPGDIDILRHAHTRQKSILDLVKTDADQLRRRIGKADQEKLDHYFTSVRDLEKRLTQSEAWLDQPKPQVDYQLPNDADELDFVDRLPLYYDLITLALQTDSTRVLTLEVSNLGANSGGLPLTKGYHQLTHHGKVESYIDELSIIEKVHTGNFARFLGQLSSIQEPNGKSLLENTMALFGSGMGNASSHSNQDLPLVLAGGGFKHGNHLRFEKNKATGTQTPACNLFLSMLQRFGLETNKFNTSTGPLTGLNLA